MFLQIPAFEAFLFLHRELRAGAGAGICAGKNFGVLDAKVHVQGNEWQLI
jgi:hypothetical protein